jgi:hypothetical protein
VREFSDELRWSWPFFEQESERAFSGQALTAFYFVCVLHLRALMHAYFSSREHRREECVLQVELDRDFAVILIPLNVFTQCVDVAEKFPVHVLV